MLLRIPEGVSGADTRSQPVDERQKPSSLTPTQLVIFPAAEPQRRHCPTAVMIGQIARAALHCKYGGFWSRSVPTLAGRCLRGAGPCRRLRLGWPLRPPPAVVRQFDAASPIESGHRGVDLPGAPGQPVYAAGSDGQPAGLPRTARLTAHLRATHQLRAGSRPGPGVGQPVSAPTVIVARWRLAPCARPPPVCTGAINSASCQLCRSASLLKSTPIRVSRRHP